MIEELTSIPQLERYEEGYSYDVKYQNTIFLFKGNYILFHEASFETIPKKIIDLSISQILQDKLEEIQDNISAQVLEKINSESVHFEEQVEENNIITEEQIIKIFDDKIAYSLQNINRVIDNIFDKINSKPDIIDLQTLREQIEKGVNLLLSEHVNTSFQNIEENPVQFDNCKISELETKIDNLYNINQQNQINVNDIDKRIASELEIVYVGVKKMINEAFSNYNPHDNSESAIIKYKIKQLDQGLQTSKIKLSTLMMLKDSGFTISEIAEAQREGLI